MMGHKICLNKEIWLIIPKLSLLPLLIWSTVVHFDNSVIIFLGAVHSRKSHVDSN